MKKILVLLILLPTVGFAQTTTMFIEDEQISLRNLAQARLRIADHQENLATADFATLRRVINVSRACQLAARYLLGMKPDVNQNRPPRPQEVASGKQWVQTCRSRAQNNGFTNVLEKLDLVDLSLSYEDYTVADFPAVIGPHGDFNKAQLSIGRAQRYLHHAMYDAINFLEQLSLPANNGPRMTHLFRQFARANEAFIRAQMIDAGMPLPNDLVKINDLCNAGSGTRPCEFFNSTVVGEYLYTNDRLDKSGIDGRDPELGATLFYQEMIYAWEDVVAFQIQRHPIEDIRCWYQLDRTDINAGGCGMAMEFRRDLADSWRDFDGWAQTMLDFIHAPPGPPVPPGTVP